MLENNSLTSRSCARNDKQEPAKFRSLITASQVREIVMTLNSEPFDENLTLFAFDELTKKDLKKILLKVLSEIDPGFEGEEGEETAAKVTEMMSLVDYPEYSDEIGKLLIEKGVRQTEQMERSVKDMKKVMYYLLMNLETCRKRAYLGKFLVGVPVPEELLMDSEMKELGEECRELMEYFREEHADLAGQEGDRRELEQEREEMAQLEREKEQLIIRLKTYQHSGTQTREFKEILKATSELRQMQEEEARLTEKLLMQERGLENYEAEVVMGSQRVATMEEKMGYEVSAEELMKRAENEDEMLKVMVRELDLELEAKMKRVQDNARKLDVKIEESELGDMQRLILKMRAILEDLDVRLDKVEDEEKEERLKIFRRQVAVVEKKVEDLEIEKLEGRERKVELEISCGKLKEELAERGIAEDEMEMDDLAEFQDRLGSKLRQRNAKQEEVNALERERSVLTRTEEILKGELLKSEKVVGEFEEKFGVKGFWGMEEKLENLTRKKGDIDQVKGQNLEELSEIVKELVAKIAEKRGDLQPLVDKQKRVKTEIKQMETEHSKLKVDYWSDMRGLKEEYEALVGEVTMKRKQMFDKEVKREQLIEKGAVLKLYLGLMGHEGGSQGRLNEEFKSHGDWMDVKVVQVEQAIQKLKVRREAGSGKEKKNQMTFLNKLKMLIRAKVKAEKENRGEGFVNGDQHLGVNTQRETYNRLVME